MHSSPRSTALSRRAHRERVRCPLSTRLLCVLLGVGGTAESRVAAAPREVWVDANASEAGDGSRDKPFKDLRRALEWASTQVVLHIAAGLYPGPFRPKAGTRLVGSPSAVLFAEGRETVVAPQGSLFVEDLAIQWGEIGVRSAFDVHLKRVHFSGQRKAVLELSLGSLTAEQSVFTASVSETSGVKILGKASAVLISCVFDGPFRRGMEVRSSRVEMTGCRFDGPLTGVHQNGGKVAISKTRFTGGTGPAIFSAQGDLTLTGVSVRGHEYGLQAGNGSRIKAVDFYSVNADRAAIALVKSHADLEEVVIIDSGPFAAIQLVGAQAAIRRFWLYRSTNYAVLARNSQIALKNGLISEVRNPDHAAGSGIESRQSKGSVESVLIRRASGAGVLAAEGSELTLRDLTIEGSGWAGLIAETSTTVGGSSWEIGNSSSAAMAVPDQSKLVVDSLSLKGNREGAVWAECAKGAQIRLSRVRADTEIESSPCIELLSP